MLAMEWVLGSSTSLLCLHGAPFRPRGLGSVVSVVLLRRCRDTYEYRTLGSSALCCWRCWPTRHSSFLRIEDAPKNGRSRGVSIGAKRSCPAYTSLPPALTSASRCPSRSERSPCLLSCSSTTSSSMRRAAPRCAPPPRRVDTCAVLAPCVPAHSPLLRVVRHRQPGDRGGDRHRPGGRQGGHR